MVPFFFTAGARSMVFWYLKKKGDEKEKDTIYTSWVIHDQDQHGSGLESVIFWLQWISYILKKEKKGKH